MSKIIAFKAENFKKLRVVEFQPDGQVVRITGKNGAGKTSVLDGIECTLAGGERVPAKPLRKGAEKGMIRLDIGDGKVVEWTITRQFSAKDRLGQLIIESPNGARMPRPQSFLDTIRGPGITCDPLAFTRMKPAEQGETVRRVAKIETDIDALRGRNKADYEARTDANREAAQLRARAEGIAYPADTPAEAPDVAAAAEALRGGSEMNTARERMIAERTRLLDRAATLRAQAEVEEGPSEAIASVERQHNELVANARSRIAALEAEIALQRLAIQSAEEVLPEAIATLRQQHKERAAALRAAADEAVAALPEIPDEVDIDALMRVLNSTQLIKEHVEARKRRETLEAEAAALEERAANLTEAMDARNAEINRAIAEAAMPVPGLGFDEDMALLLNGLPFEQASSAEQLRVSAAIAMAGNPKLRIMLVRDGSLLDEDSFKLLAQMASERDFQLWIEQVETDGRVGVLLEDGALAAADEPRLALE